ncbi:MAG: zinc ribbon domain-containing protein [Candidatus Omnitrophica bacterium]|nr:zinc ribbon domain-containing protein [Candidatus Omnitrophota bacterium]MDD5488153.1 zinc ribbon domain-containing protein [Candidatus Omnitrophota bacterium]
MPTYEYECEKCGGHFEKFQSMTDEPVKTCPDCGGKAKRLVSPGSGIIFKGKGFYQTDYKPTGKPSGTTGKTPKCGTSDGCKGCPANGTE